MLVYLSYPIDRSTPESLSNAADLKAHFMNSDKLADWLLFDPRQMLGVHQGALSKKTCGQIVEVNQGALFLAEIVVVIYTPGVESWGTPMELYATSLRQIPILVYSPSVSHETLPPYLKHFVEEKYTFQSPQSLINELQELYSG